MTSLDSADKAGLTKGNSKKLLSSKQSANQADADHRLRVLRIALQKPAIAPHISKEARHDVLVDNIKQETDRRIRISVDGAVLDEV